jgi:hypothetical protein
MIIEQTTTTTRLCKKCGAKVGLFDATQNRFHIRRKDIDVWVSLPARLDVSCFRCGDVNQLA